MEVSIRVGQCIDPHKNLQARESRRGSFLFLCLATRIESIVTEPDYKVTQTYASQQFAQ